MRIDEIAKQYMILNNLDNLTMAKPGEFHDIYDIYKQQKTYRKFKNLREHPRDVMHCISRALSKSPLFKISGKIGCCWGCLNVYRLI